MHNLISFEVLPFNFGQDNKIATQSSQSNILHQAYLGKNPKSHPNYVGEI